MTAVFWAAGKEAPGWTRSTEPLGPALAGLCRRPLTRVLSFFYVVTFGGFLALSVHLPTLLVEAYGMDGGRAGAHVAVFAIVGTLARPVGGHLADRFGGGRVLFMTFPAIAALAGALALEPGHLLVTSVLLGLGLSLGTGNGAVFELVAKRFTGGAGLAGGVVGAVGASGGIVLPIAQGLAQDLVGSYVVGFVLLAGLALVAWLLSLRVPSGQLPAGAE